MPTLQQQINAKKEAIATLKASLVIALHPPDLAIDRSAYAPLDRIEAILSQAKSAEESKLIVETLTAEIANEEETIVELEKQLAEVEQMLIQGVTEARKAAKTAHTSYQSYLDAICKLHEVSNALVEYRRLTSNVEARPLTLTQPDRLSLSNAIGFAVDNGGKIVARLDHFAVLGF